MVCDGSLNMEIKSRNRNLHRLFMRLVENPGNNTSQDMLDAYLGENNLDHTQVAVYLQAMLNKARREGAGHE